MEIKPFTPSETQLEMLNTDKELRMVVNRWNGKWLYYRWLDFLNKLLKDMAQPHA